MKILGITGGVGSGKSEVLCFLGSEYRAYIVQLDEVARALQRKGTGCFEKIVDCFGAGVVGLDGELDRAALADLVFCREESLVRLNAIVHPEVEAWVKCDIREKAKQGIPLYVVESALLLETGYDRICDEIWFVYADQKVRRSRLKASRGYTDEKIDRMMQSQSPETFFREKCDHTIDNSGSFENTKKQIGEML